jgi:tetratricopeptide (TPR) repeat protein
MRLEISHTGKRLALTVFLLLVFAIYLGLAGAQFLAAYFSETPKSSYLHWAIRLDPFNAEYSDLAGRFELLLQSPAAALPLLRTATVLNPHHAGYWLDRATAERLLGDTQSQRESLMHASAANPHSGNLTWELANRYLAEKDYEDALREYRKVMENDPALMPQAIQICWKIRPDVDWLLQHVVPAHVDKAFLAILLADRQPQAAAKVWQRIVDLQQPVERTLLFDYLRYLIGEGDPVEAARVWQKAANLSELSEYQATDGNLLVNGDFSLGILNGGFDWTYQKIREVTLAIDPTKAHSGSRSLRISFEGQGIVDAGIRQLVSVDPNKEYEFSGYYQAEDMDGAGGPRLSIEDFYTGADLFTSDDLRNAAFWTRVRGAFTTGADTHLLVLRIVRVPVGSPIRGTVWIDNLKLVAADHPVSAEEVHP